MKNAIASASLDLYQKLKPKDYCDANYTVVAALHDNIRGTLLALATGTQAINKRYQDDIEDCHAESLLKRAYKRYLINRISNLVNSQQPERDIKQVIKSECETSLTIFISQFPCGLVRRYEGETLVKNRKPGRGLNKDANVIYVEKDCCLLKLKKWASKGFQGTKLHELFGLKSTLDRIIIAGCETNHELDYSHYAKLLATEVTCDGTMNVETCDHMRLDELVFKSGKKPQPVSIVWWNGTLSSAIGMPRKKLRLDQGPSTTEFVVDGQRKGITKKQRARNEHQYKLSISTVSLRRDISTIHYSMTRMID